MNCYLCPDRSKFYCPCSNCFICSNHKVQHLRKPIAHSIELIDRALPDLKLNALKEKLMGRIKTIKEAKQSILTQMKDLIQKIMNSGNSALKEIEIQRQWYLKLVSINGFTSEILKEVDHIINSKFKIDFLKQESSSKISDIIDEILRPEVTDVFAGKKRYKSSKNCKCGGLNCKKCVASGFLDNKATTLKKENPGKCEMCAIIDIAVQNRLCKHWRCKFCEISRCDLCITEVKQKDIPEKKMDSDRGKSVHVDMNFKNRNYLYKNTCRLCGKACVLDFCYVCSQLNKKKG